LSREKKSSTAFPPDKRATTACRWNLSRDEPTAFAHPN